MSTEAFGPAAQAAHRAALPQVPLKYPGATIVCLATGPSLTANDLDALERAALPTIAINNASLHAPWAEIQYAADLCWWEWYHTVVDRARDHLRYGLQPEIRERYSDVTVLERGLSDGIDGRRTHLASGGHSGYQAINLAVHLGAATILLVGYDMQPAVDPVTGRWQHHAFGREHPNATHLHYSRRIGVYQTLLAPLAIRGIAIYNCSPRTAITALPRRRLADCLASVS